MHCNVIKCIIMYMFSSATSLSQTQMLPVHAILEMRDIVVIQTLVLLQARKPYRKSKTQHLHYH